MGQTYCAPTITGILNSGCDYGGTYYGNITNITITTSATPAQTIFNNSEPQNNCGNVDNGYSDFTYPGGVAPVTPPTLSAGVTYNFSVTWGFCDGATPYYLGIWVDCNNDGTYTNSEYNASSNPSGERFFDDSLFTTAQLEAPTVTGTITLPQGLAAGSYRIRFRMLEANCSTFGVWPCTNGTSCGTGHAFGSFGEAQDYTINVTPYPANCEGATALSLSSFTLGSYSNSNMQVIGNVTGAAGTPALTGCTTSTIINEKWYDITANNTNAFVVFQNGSTTATGYVYVYSGSCGDLTYVNCAQFNKSETQGATCLVDFATVSGSTYYIRIVQTGGTGNVFGNLGAFSSSQTNAALMPVDFRSYATGWNGDNDEKVDDGTMVTGYGGEGTGGFAGQWCYSKFITTALPASTAVLWTTTPIISVFNYCYDYYGEGGEVLIPIQTSTDPTIASYSSIWNSDSWYGSPSPIWGSTNVSGKWATNTTMCYMLNSTGSSNFQSSYKSYTDSYGNTWWGCVYLSNYSTGWGPGFTGGDSFFDGWSGVYPPFAVIVYTSASTGMTVCTGFDCNKLRRDI